MAATDKPYRNQYRLDVVFGVSCILLLLTTGWMMYDDHNRPFKVVQRQFRDVEDALYLQQMLDKFPADRLGEIEEQQKAVDAARDDVTEEKKKVGKKVEGDAEAWLKQKELEKARLEAQFLDTKATYDSEVSLYNIVVDERDKAPEGSHKAKLAREAQEKKEIVERYEKKLADLQRQSNENQTAVDAALADQRRAEEKLAAAQDKLKEMTNDFDRLAKTAAQKRWKFGDTFRSLPIIDGFASAYKIQQVTLNDLTIDYGGFKDVPRYDRCTTCHLAIDRASFDPASLRRLDLADKAGDSEEEKKAKKERREELKKRHAAALKFLKERQERIEALEKRKEPHETLGFDPDDLGKDVPSVRLTEGQVTQYRAHPRLDLFVDANSPHPMEKFGCTACHAGQGSATEFTLATHTPNGAGQKRQWEKEHGWELFRDWEFPMLPARFVESSCLKCHHQVTDLIRQGSKEEAPKLLKGYNLVRENGCFGCHEITGMKAGKEIGPDLRLEPSPALEYLTADERARILADASNPPGALRKVGPSLRRISEKTTEEWARKWINSPRGFRPDTRMPHFYNLSNNTRDVLPEDETEPNNPDKNQKDFPEAEVRSIAHYLFAESAKYLDGKDNYLTLARAREQELLRLQKDNQLSDKQAKELIEVQRRIELAVVPTPLEKQIVDADGKPIPDAEIPPKADDDKDRQEGRRLFTERGCLACHSHAGTETAAGGVTAVHGEAQFGPNLSRTAAKINGDKGRRWLIQWIINPNVHFPRTRMPITHLTPKEAGQVADWLLSQEVKDWADKDLPAPSRETLVRLAKVYLRKAPNVNPLEVDDVLANGFPKERTDRQSKDPQKILPEADEQVLQGSITEDKLMNYIGKKAVSRQGCFACHDIPGFESAKPIGTPLNDWGKKDPARMAFEDIGAYVKEKYRVVDRRDDPKDRTKPADDWAEKDGKKPYEKFFADALDAHLREGFLHQKLLEPRSYDYHRDVKWDERLRMPQFKFAHPRKEKGESDEEFAARADKEEAEAREAVMTFVLGLVAEPTHPRYLNNPAPDRLAEVKGRQVLDKFNCAGCHLVRPGVYEFKLTDESHKLLKFSHDTVAKGLTNDYGHEFAFSNSWGSPPPAAPDRLTVHGVRPGTRKPSTREVEQLNVDRDRDLLRVRLADAAAFLADPADPKTVKVFPAGVNVSVFQDQLVSRSDPFGGGFTELMVPYLAKKDGTKYKLEDGDSNTARRDLPPPLVREGEKAQPDWLFNFLRNPTPIRPQVILRMPKFNMSDEEARALVNYFAAADKTNNPGIGLTYPYLTVREREETYWRDRARGYWERTGKEQGLEARRKRLQDEDLPAAKKKVEDAKTDADRQDAARDVAVVEAQIKALQELAAKKEEAPDSAYWHEAYKLIATPRKSICLDCHRVGAVTAKEEQGPPLELAFARLRPDWTERWMANPDRLLTYPTPMPQNFPRGQPLFQELFPGSSREQVGATRDVLMNLPRVAELPVNRTYRAATSGGK